MIFPKQIFPIDLKFKYFTSFNIIISTNSQVETLKNSGVMCARLKLKKKRSLKLG